MHWTPERRNIPCVSTLCSSVNRFLGSNERAISIATRTDLEIQHVNLWLLHWAKTIRCKFKVEGGDVIIEKVMGIGQGPGLSLWTDRRKRASAEVSKLDCDALRAILGDDYGIIVFYDPVLHAQCHPVPVEDLDQELEAHFPPAAFARVAGANYQAQYTSPYPVATRTASHHTAVAANYCSLVEAGYPANTATPLAVHKFAPYNSYHTAMNNRWKQM